MSKVSLPKDKIKILLLEGLHPSAVETLNNNGYQNIESLKTSLPEDELIEVTPEKIRMRKMELDANKRISAAKKNKE